MAGNSMSGRKKMPLELLKLNGTADRNPKKFSDRTESRLDGYEISLNRPNFKYEQTSRTWDSMVPALCSLGLVTAQDSGTIMQMFELLDEYHRILQEMKRFGKEHTITEIVTTPELMDQETKLSYRKMKVLDAYSKIAYRFGVTPVERMKLNLTTKKEDKDDIDSILEG